MSEKISPEAAAELDAAMGLISEEPGTPAEESGDSQQDSAQSEPPPNASQEEAAAGQAEPQKAPDPGPPVSEQLPELLRFKRQAEKTAREAQERASREVAELKAQLEELQAKVKAPLEDPVSYFREAGLSPLEVAKTLAAAELPADKADPNARLRYEQMMAKKAQMSEIDKVRVELAEFKKAQQEAQEAREAERIIAEIRGQDETMLQSQQDSNSLVASLYRTQPDYVLGQLLEIRRRYAQQYPEDPVPTAEQAAELLESQLAPIASAFRPAEPPRAEVPKTQKQPKPTGEQVSLSSQQLAGRTGKDDLPDDEEEMVQFLAERLRSGNFA